MRQPKDKAIKARNDFLDKRRFNQLSDSKRVIWMTYQDAATPCTKIAKYFDKFATD